MSCWKQKAVYRYVSLILVFVLLFSQLNMGVSATSEGVQTPVCGEEGHVHTEDCEIESDEEDLTEDEETEETESEEIEETEETEELEESEKPVIEIMPEVSHEETAAVFLAEPEANTIYFDLSLGNVSINESTYSGKVYVYNGAQYKETTVSGAHSNENQYYVFQSNGENRGYVTKSGESVESVVYPQYDPMENWGAEMKDNSDVAAVAALWEQNAAGRDAVDHNIVIYGSGTYHVTIDNVWSSYQEANSNRSTGGVTVNPREDGETYVTFKGNNRLQNIFYRSSKADGADIGEASLSIGGASENDTLTVIDDSRTDYAAVIGSSDNVDEAFGMKFTKGYIYVGAHEGVNTTAIGGGGNGNVDIKITGGVITAVGRGVGAGIGGGCGWSGNAGFGNVEITGGEVYAYADGSGAAIGGGGSNSGAGAAGNVVISGGNVTAVNSGIGKTIGGGSNSSSSAASSVAIYETAVVSGFNSNGLNYADFYNGSTKEFTLYATPNATAVPSLSRNVYYYMDSNGNSWQGKINTSGTRYYIYSLNLGDNHLYFDLYLGNVEIKNGFYSGYVTIRDGENSNVVFLQGCHANDLKYYVFQSSNSYSGCITVTDGIASAVLPNYTGLNYDGMLWGESIKEQTDVRKVAGEWDKLAENNGRTKTGNSVTVSGNAQYDVTIQDIWSTKNDLDSKRTTGGVSYEPAETSTMKLTFVGNNRLGNLYYGTSTTYNSLSVGGASDDDSLTVIAIDNERNKHNSAIGGSDSSPGRENSQGLKLTGGYIYAGTTAEDSCTAIGAGANGKADICISGGVVTAISTGNSAAIGGGYTVSGYTGDTTVVIENNAQVYAYHFGGNGAAIGGAGSNGGTVGNVEITVSGNPTVYAKNTNGIAIGGGTSSGSNANTTVLITGGNVTAVNESGGQSVGSGAGGTSSVDVFAPGILKFTSGDLYRVEYKVGESVYQVLYSSNTTTPKPESPAVDGYFVGWITADGKDWSATMTDKNTVYYAKVIAAADKNTVYFDLALGNVEINGTSYSGKIYEQSTGEILTLSGPHSDEIEYYVYQSNENGNTAPTKTGLKADGTVALANYTPIAGWANTITNNSDVDAVVSGWITKAGETGRTKTYNKILVSGDKNYQVTIQDLWIGYDLKPNHSTGTNGRGDKEGAIAYAPNGNSQMTLTFVGDNRMDNILYRGSTEKNALTIQGNSKTDTLTAAATSTATNWWCSAIGSSDNSENVYNLSFVKGIVFAGTTRFDNATAIGGGGNGFGQILISGEDTVVTAVASTTGTAIGGGIGQSQAGGSAEVTISGGEVYAYNHGILLEDSDGNLRAVPAAAIGGGSSIQSDGKDATVTITDGKVYAESTYGSAIGGGGSATKNGGSATVKISGGEVTAISKKGTLRGTIQYESYNKDSGVYEKDSQNVTQEQSAGVSIGGGTALLSGGYADLTISGDNTIVNTGSIGGGECTGEGPLGYAKVDISGGTIQGQVIMQETGKKDEFCSFTMDGGTIDNSNHKNDPEGDGTFKVGNYTYYFVEENGGAVCMKDRYGETLISGDALIKNCRGTNGGAVYMTGGIFTMTDGTIQNCTAKENGGAVYLGGGKVAFEGGTITQNNAGSNGGGIAVNNGSIVMSDGLIRSNKAVAGSGGGIYVSSTSEESVSAIVYSGTLSGNTAKTSGGAIGMVGHVDSTITVQVGLNQQHKFVTEDTFEPITHSPYIHTYCPIVENNTADTSGGAIYIEGGKTTNLNIFCLEEGENTATGDKDVHGTALSDFIMVRGGQVIISTAEGTNAYNGTDYGNTHIKGSIHVVAGVMELIGSMDNPNHEGIRTIDLQSDDDRYFDNRTSGHKVKVSYHENFKDPDGVIDSTQTAFDIEGGTTHTIETGLYVHDGYELYGWNISKDATEKTVGGWYWPGTTFTLYNPSTNPKPDTLEGDVDYVNSIHYGDLQLYAIWKVNGYFIAFDSGVPAGETWSGSVATIPCNYVETKELPENGFIYPGHIFTGWKLGDKIYQPKDKVKELSNKNAETVTFVAQWEVCEHKDAQQQDVCIYTVNDAKDTITKTCPLCQLTAAAKLTTQDAVYDKISHPANLECSNEAFWNPEITYTAAKIGGAAVGTWPAEIAKNCINAGVYTASITDDGTNVVTVSFTIAKAEQPAPDVRPTYVLPGSDGTLKIQRLEKETHEGYDEAPVEYYVRYYESNEEKNIKVGEKADTTDPILYQLDQALKTYAVLARYGETDNYKASDYISAEATFVFAGNISVTILAEDGIDILPGNVDSNEFKFYAKLWDGYYLPKGEYTFTKELLSGTYDLNNIEINPIRNETDGYAVKATTSDNAVQITITVGGARKDPAIEGKVTGNQYFSDFTGALSTEISRDSAFTAQFVFEGFYNEFFETPAIHMTAHQPDTGYQIPALVDGATIIMRDLSDGSYWYYEVPITGGNGILLNEFIQMGNSATKYSVKDGDLKLQFVVDYSNVNLDTYSRWKEVTKLTCTLENNQKANNDATVTVKVPELKSVEIGLKDTKYSLALSDTGNDALSKSFDLDIKMNAEASKYDHRDLVLVLNDITGGPLPVDASILASYGESNISYVPNQRGAIIIPLGNVEDQSESIGLQLVSNMFPMGTVTYTMDACLYLACSDAEIAPMNGAELACVENLTFINVRDDTGIRVTESTDKRIYNIGDQITVNVTTKPAELESKYQLSVQVHEELNGVYGNTALQYTKSGSNYTFDLSTLHSGNYCVVATLTNDAGYVTSESRYYIIVKNADN